MSTLNFTSLLKKLTVDSKDDGKQFLVFDRISAIKSLLDESDYELLKEGKLMFLYGKQPIDNKEIVLISSHIDCVYQKCFCEEKDEYFQGTFDNSLTNAAIIYNALNNKFHENVVLAFTGDEEKDSGGALELINYIINKTNCIVRFAIVTDVSNEGWDDKVPFSVENDLGIDLFTAHHIFELLNPYFYSFTHHGEPDESWDYDSVHIPCLTLCTPVLGDMHHDNGVLVRKKSIPTYCQVLSLLANSLAE